MVASLGEESYNSLQRYWRQYYQHPPVESILLGSLAVHIGTSLIRRWKKLTATTAKTSVNGNNATSSQPTKRWLSQQLHTFTGYFLALIVVGHVYFCRKGVPPEYGGLAFLLRHPTLRVLFTPYFLFFAMAGLYHMVVGFPTAVRFVFGTGLPAGLSFSVYRIPRWVVVGVMVGCGALLGGVLTLGGHTGWDHNATETFADSAYARENHM